VTVYGRRRRLSMQSIFLLIHGVGWLFTMAVVAIASTNHVPPSELWTALPLGLSAILVAFRTDGSHRNRPPPDQERRDE
jgi:hypothetical protein